MVVAWLMVGSSQVVVSQSFQLGCTGVTALSGSFSTTSGTLRAFAGQAAPIESVSKNEAYKLMTGSVSCLMEVNNQARCEGSVLARTGAPEEFPRGSRIEVPLYVDMSEALAPNDKLGSYSGTLRWETSRVRYHSHVSSSDVVGVVNDANARNGQLEFNGVSPQGLAGNVEILRVVFDVVGNEGERGLLDLNYTDLHAAETFQDLMACLATEDSPFSIEASSTCQVCGDLNQDNIVTSSDALIILSYDVGLSLPPAFRQNISAGCGEVNGDGLTSSADALVILSYDTGLRVPFPVGSPGSCDASEASTHVQHDMPSKEPAAEDADEY